jgi:hypothetical protein
MEVTGNSRQEADAGSGASLLLVTLLPPVTFIPMVYNVAARSAQGIRCDELRVWPG